VVIERPHSAAVRDVATLINDVKTLRPSSVGIIGGVAHVVRCRRAGENLNLFVKSFAMIKRCSSVFGLRVSRRHPFLEIGFHLPLVGGMRFADVDSQKIGVLFIVVVNLDHVAYLATERRSSKAAENQHERSITRSFADMKIG